MTVSRTRGDAAAGTAPQHGSTGRPVTRGVAVVALTATALLAVSGGGYGFHRDELYFIEAGLHPAWGYPDQPAIVPLLAAAWHRLVGGSLWGFRLLPAAATGLLIVVAGATSAALHGTRRERVATAALVGLNTAVVVIGHVFSTATFDVLLTATVVWLLLRALAVPVERALGRWVAVGLATGVALHVKLLPLMVLAACALALVLVGPREHLRRAGPWTAAGIAAVLVTPHLLWQAANGWPQLALSSAIAAGSSGTSADRALVVPLTVMQAGPIVAAVMIAGLVTLLRDPRWRPHRWIAVAYLLLLTMVVVTGGKPYYTLGLMPAVVAAGAPAALRWLDGDRAGRAVVAALVLVQVAVSAVIALPVVPAARLAATPVTDINYDAGETVGWDRFVGTVVAAGRQVPAAQRATTIVLTANYGEAGALDRARRAGAALPPVYSGHNAYGLWGPPPPTARTVVLVGHHAGAHRWFGRCTPAGRVDNGVGLDNEEQGAPVQVCQRPRRPWTRLWPDLVHLG